MLTAGFKLLARSRALLLVTAAVATPAWAAPPDGFAQRVEQVRTKIGVPGVAITIVENGQPTLAQGWGTQMVGSNRPVGPQTIFQTGSTGKAFTTAALAILVDQGKLKWDSAVIDYMPWFRMYDPWVTREITVRDLLVHRSGLGLGAGDLLFLPNSDLSRRETVERLGRIKPATSFRSGYAYDNVLYMVAGQLIEEVSGRTWEQFVREQIFAPLGMNESTVSDREYLATADRAHAHVRSDGPIVGLGAQKPLDGDALIAANAAPAGGLSISADDMSRWLQVQLARGKIPGSDRRLWSEEQAAQMWDPVVIQPIAPAIPGFEAVQPNFETYALGWDVRDYRGAKLIWHGGAVFGSLAAVALLPDRNVGIYIAANANEGQLVRGLLYELLDHYLGAPAAGWPEKYDVIRTKRIADAAAQVQQEEKAPVKAGPSLPLDRYAGDFTDPWYGTINVRRAGQGLHIEFPHSTGMDGPLTHYQYDTFRTNPTLKWVEPAYVTFSLGANGTVERVTMKPVSPIADFSFDFQDLLFTPAAKGEAK
ncbi:serine hydrolase [Sphingomonas sabuli]|uniref:Serine hydrolase n=1 Tax=Sphingomonas sabuli TaxID=2764186 RepID=A0A7G9KZV6_9SPHN|nr:serine hydrolase [Sphingomonas sabuli]QNM81905.1 serine hydrolase [Sphingomonas sabuli]